MRINELLKPITMILFLIILLFIVVIIALMFGPAGPFGTTNYKSDLTPQNIIEILFFPNSKWNNFNGQNLNAIILEIRLPRVLLAGLVGSALAVAGTVMQSIFRNPLADPFILGASSGAALFELLTIVYFSAFITTVYTLPFIGFLGAFLTVILVLTLGKIHGRIQTETLLLAGVALSSFLSAFITFFLFQNQRYGFEFYFWMLGSFYKAAFAEVYITAILVIPIIFIIYLFYRELNLFLLNEEEALSLGMNVERVRLVLIILVTLITAVSVAFVGIIGFVGLIIPHIIRLITGPNHSILLPATTFFGASFLITMDTISRTIIPNHELPIGVITALTGVPFFIYLLIKRNKYE